MRTKLIASVGIAGLILLGVPAAASALTTSVVDAPGAVIAVDEDGDGTPITRTFNVTADGLVTKATLLFDFESSRSTVCGIDADYDSHYPDELALSLISPTGTTVPLVYTWGEGEGADADSTFIYTEEPLGQMQILFDDAAAVMVGTTNGRIPESGTFKPVMPLAAVNGETAVGVWSLVISDDDRGAAQCYYGATLNIETDAVDEVPVEEVKPPVTAPTPPVKVDTAA